MYKKISRASHDSKCIGKYSSSLNILAISASGRLTANSICRTTLKKLIAGEMSILMVTNIDVLATNERTNELPRSREIERSARA